VRSPPEERIRRNGRTNLRSFYYHRAAGPTGHPSSTPPPHPRPPHNHHVRPRNVSRVGASRDGQYHIPVCAEAVRGRPAVTDPWDITVYQQGAVGNDRALHDYIAATPGVAKVENLAFLRARFPEGEKSMRK